MQAEAYHVRVIFSVLATEEVLRVLQNAAMGGDG